MDNEKKLKITCIQNNSGSRFYRIVPQLRTMQRQGHEICLLNHDEYKVMEDRIKWADIVIFQLVFSPEWIDFAKKNGKKVIFECDDLIHTVPKGHYSYKETSGFNKIKWLWRIYRTIGKCDGFISTNKNLDRIYGWLAKKSFVFDNYLDLEHWARPHRKNETDRIRILWAGSSSHTPDLIWIRPVLDKILRKYPNVQFLHIGQGGIKSSNKLSQFVYGEDIFEGLPDNRESLLPVQSSVFPFVLSSLMADMAIAPLQKNYFNKFKSQCKYLEYSINHLPGVYSGWFYDRIRHGETGFLADTPEEWERYLTLLVENEKIRKETGENAYRDALKYDFSLFADKWIEFIKSI